MSRAPNLRRHHFPVGGSPGLEQESERSLKVYILVPGFPQPAGALMEKAMRNSDHLPPVLFFFFQSRSFFSDLFPLKSNFFPVTFLFPTETFSLVYFFIFLFPPHLLPFLLKSLIPSSFS